MSRLIAALSLLVALSIPGVSRGQDSTAATPAPDTALAPAADSSTVSRQPTTVGIVVTGAIAWYPGAVVGGFAGLGLPVRRCPSCEYAGLSNILLGAVVGGGATAGLAAGGEAFALTPCSRGKRLARGLLGGEIGSLAGALVTGAIGASTAGIGLAAAPVVIPVASALVAVMYVRRCR